MIDQIDIFNTLFLDIETVSEQPNFLDLSEDFRHFWMLKCKQLTKQYEDPINEETAADLYIEKAAIFAEFGKIVCISVGIVHRDSSGKLVVRLKSFANASEKILLQQFLQLIEQHYSDVNKHYICGHNIKEFDIPYICRRMVINQLPFPNPLNLSGKRPWETKHLIDTLELWKFGDYKHYTSLNLLATVLNFPSPKGEMDGSQVGRVFWQQDDLEKIAVYCEKDVLATIQLFLRYKRLPILEEDQVICVPRN
jgi:predicted PolB exonuclease-like 3'-5' exonuclease